MCNLKHQLSENTLRIYRNFKKGTVFCIQSVSVGCKIYRVANMTRSEAREQAFFVLFDKIFNKESTLSEIIEKAEESELIKVNTFAKSILLKVEENAEEIDRIIDEKTTGWAVPRLPKVSLAVLRLAVAEIKYDDDIPAGVAINEAVEIAKKYGTPEDASYINGVLGAIAKS